MTTLDKNSQSKQKSVSIVLIETNGTIKTLKTKEVTEETLHKKCGFRINDDFLPRHTWRVTLKENNEKNSIPYTVCVWAKKTGKANFENKYDFPPPIDNDLFFGTCAIVRMAEPADATSPGDFLDLTKETWLKIYEKLFGGFEDIGDEDEFSEDELENVSKDLKTKKGYLKDGFVIEDEDEDDVDEYEDDDDDDEDSEDEDEEEEGVVSGSGGGSSKHFNPKPAIARLVDDEDNDLYEDGAGSELEEEEYEYSDDEE